MPDSTGKGRLSQFFWFACAFEGALLLLAAVIAYFAGQPLLSDLHWSATDFLLGLGASVPLYVLFWWGLRSSFGPLADIRQVLAKIRPLFESWSLAQLGTISVIAGLCEEMLFRSVIQGALAAFAGPVLGLIAASVLFGLAHLVTIAYGIIAAVIGSYLGLLWIFGENLLIPIVTHAVYDFAALVYLLRSRRSWSAC